MRTPDKTGGKTPSSHEKKPKRPPSADDGIKYKVLFEQSPYGIATIDLSGKILDFNERAHSELGYTREEFSRLFIHDIDPDVSVADAPVRARQILEAGGDEFDARHRTKQGEMRYVHVIVRPVALPEQTILHSIWQDITERKKAEETIRKFADVVQHTRIGIAIGTMDGKLGLMNPAFAEMHGYGMDELAGRPVPDVYAPDVRSRIPEYMAAINKNGYHEFETVRLRKDGSVFPAQVQAYAIKDKEGNVLYRITNVQDIAGRKKAEEALRYSEEFIRNILDNVDESFMVIDRDFRILAANRTFCKWNDIGGLPVKGRHCYEVIHKETQPCHESGKYNCAVKLMFETGEPGAVTDRHETPEGDLLDIEKRAFPFRNSSGEVTAAIETVHNITERRMLEKEQLQSEKLKAIGTLAGGIAHDFNNLLQGVFGYVSLTKIDLDPKGKAFANLERVEKALNMSISLANQLLTFSKGGRPVKKKLALLPIVESSAGFALSGSRSVSRLVYGKDLWIVEADEGQMEQVVQNIVLNASEAMPHGGVVEIGIANVEVPKGSKPALPEGGKFIRLNIKDTGIGIPKQYLSKIFDPYFTTKQKGSGLGLATSYSIIRNHGGMIEVASEANKGSTFSVYIPAVEPDAGEEARPSRPPAKRKARVLVMDDEEIIRDVAMMMITELGHKGESASDGADAILKFRNAADQGKPFDVVILDLTVKRGLGGEHVISQLREMQPGIKAIVSSGYSDNPVVSDYRSHGFSAFLNKPYRISALKDCLDGLLLTDEKP